MFFAANPLFSSYLQSDGFGKAIFWALFVSSLIVWSLLIYKVWLFFKVEKEAKAFRARFSEKDPLSFQFPQAYKNNIFNIPNPFFEIYKTFKQSTLQIIDRNHQFAPDRETALSEADLGLLQMQVQNVIARQSKGLEKNLFVLSTVVTLAPFLGLLGTVWGILLTFSSLHERGVSLSSAVMLSGLSLALATTVAGLVIAIPALIGNNFLRNKGREFRREMEDFSEVLLISIELNYRRPAHAEKTTSFS